MNMFTRMSNSGGWRVYSVAAALCLECNLDANWMPKVPWLPIQELIIDSNLFAGWTFKWMPKVPWLLFVKCPKQNISCSILCLLNSQLDAQVALASDSGANN